MNESDIFIAALDRETVEARKAYLDLVCGRDTTLRKRIDALLESHVDAGSLLEHPAIHASGTAPTDGGEPRTPAQHGAGPPSDAIADQVALDFLAPSTRPDSLGRLGQYEVLEVVGRGGMGVVLKRHDTKLNRVVAVKLLAPELAGNATARRRFLREAQAAAAVPHQHLVAIHAVEEDRLPYLVMEFIDGQSLQQKIDRQGHLELKEILRIGMQVASGLAAAHAQGLIHRDIKPANILLENGIERVRITDFGLARAVDDTSVTKTGEVTGTPQYMSPEQAQGLAVDARSDLFSLGCVLYAMCTGRSPFRAESTVAVIRRVCDDTPRPVREVNREIPQWLGEIIEGLLSKRPEDRPQTAGEVAESLGRHLAWVQDPASTRPQGVVKPRRVNSRRRRWAIAACGLVFVLIGLGLTEATGVTQVAEYVGTVLRIRTPQGTLVLEIDDPKVNVAIEGNGERLTLSGAGIEKISLRPGQYQVRATKDGKSVREELITINRGDKQVVSISLEPSGEPLAPGEIRRFIGHTEPVQSVAFSPDGRRALSGAWDHTVRWWDVESGRELHRFDLREGEHRYAVQCVAVSPDGRRAIAGSVEGTAWLLDLETRKELGRCEHASSEYYGVNSVTFSRDGRLALLGNFDGVVEVWDVASWKELRRFKDIAGLWSVDASPNGRYVLTAATSVENGAPSLCLRKLEYGTEVRRFDGHTDGIWRAVFSRDGRHALSVGGDRVLHLWDIETGNEVRRFTGHTDEVHDVAFSSDGRRALSASHDGTVRLWDVETGRELHRFSGQGQVYCVAFSPDGRHAISGGQDETVRLWELPKSE